MRIAGFAGAVLLLAVIVQSLAAQAGAPSKSAAPLMSVPFRLLNGYSIVAQGTLGGNSQRNLLIDTGANPSIIDDDVARDLGLGEQEAAMALINGPVSLRMAELPVLALGPLRRQKIRVVVRDLEYMRGALGVPIDGVIGMDVLCMMNFTIDYEHQRLLFGPAAVLDADSVSFASGPPFLVVPASAGDAPLKLMVDTGTSGILLFASMRPHLRDVSFLGRADGFTMAGGFIADKLALPTVRLGGFRLGTQPAFLVSDRQGWGGGFDGLLGPAVLGLKRLTFDFESGKLRWKR